MKNITAKSVPCDELLPRDLEIVHVEYSANFLTINIRSLSDSASTLVEFPHIIGFRVLDEGNLLEFWPDCSSANGRLFEILAGGWLAQESVRPGILFAPMKIKAQEYFSQAWTTVFQLFVLENRLSAEFPPRQQTGFPRFLVPHS